MKMSLSERFRSLYQDPFAAVKGMGVSGGLRVADVGAGRGYLTVPAAMVVGSGGLVYSIEPDATKSETIRRRAASESLDNVKVLTTTAERMTEIPPGDVDLAFSVFSAHHFADRETALGEIGRILRDGGLFYVWDRVPNRITKHGTRQDELEAMRSGFSRFESLSTRRTVRGRFTK